MGRKKPNLVPERGLKQVNIETCLANLGKIKCEQVQIKKFIGTPVTMFENGMDKVNNEIYEKRRLYFPFPVYDNDNNSTCNSNKSKEKETNMSIPTQSKVTILSNEIVSPAKQKAKQIKEQCATNQPIDVAGKNTLGNVETSSNNSSNNKLPITPSKNISPTLQKGSPNSSPKKAVMVPFTSKKNKKGANPKFVDLNNELIVSVCQSKYLSTLLDKEDYRILKHVRNANANYQFVCFKLYKYKPNWYKLSDFVERIGLDLSDREIVSLYEFLKNSDIVDTDYKKEDLKVILEDLSKPDIIKICTSLRIKSPIKSKRETATKKQLIDQILKVCKTRMTLSITNTTEDLVRLEIVKNLGKHVVKIKDDFKNSFRRVYVLATFTNPHMDDIDKFFKQMMYDNIVFPDYDVKEYSVFYSQSEFNSYIEARSLAQEVDECGIKKKVSLKAIGIKIFNKLKDIPQDNDDSERYKDIPHLKRFTAESVYVRCLSYISENILGLFPKDAKEWLEYLLERYPTSRRSGSWYIFLIRIHNNLKNREHAGNLLLAAFRDDSGRFNDIDLRSLAERAEFMKNRINQLQRDNLIELLPIPIKETDFRSNMIDAQAIRGNVSGRKRDYVITDTEGNKTYKSVEDIALDHYRDEAGFTGGIHCEGAIINALFALFFWDIIYDSETVVPGIFLSKIQLYPLDLLTPHFYRHRQQSIDQRLNDISSNWSDEAVLRFVKLHWRLYGHVASFCHVNNSIVDLEFLETVVRCIGRKPLAMIFERLVKDVRQYRSGLPDLFVWNEKERKYKFVEVKGENDKLSIKQKLWFKYLESIGVEVEICYVHSIGSKKKVIKVEKTETPKKKTPRKKATSAKKTTQKKKVENIGTVEEPNGSSITDTPKKVVASSKPPAENETVADQEPSTSSSGTIGEPPRTEYPSDYDSDFEIRSPSTSPKKRKPDHQVNKENGNYDPGPSTSTTHSSPSTSQGNKRIYTENDDMGSPFKKNKSLANGKTAAKKLF